MESKKASKPVVCPFKSMPHPFPVPIPPFPRYSNFFNLATRVLIEENMLIRENTNLLNEERKKMLQEECKIIELEKENKLLMKNQRQILNEVIKMDPDNNCI